jgi:LysR family transcriptional regulator, transcriptional activator of the cysJI operon
MENFRLKVFRAVAEKQSFRRAAEALYLTQPAVTLQIKALEDELGLQLFDRSCQTIQLTAPGKELLQYAQKIAALVNAAQQHLAQFGVTDKQHLKLGVSTTIAQYVLFGFVARFRATHPDSQLHVFSANTDAVVQDLLDGTSSIALVEGPVRHALLRTEPFLEDEIVGIASATHPWGGQAVAPNQLAPVPLIFREQGSGTRRVVESVLRSAGVRLKQLNIVMQMNSTEAIKAAVEAGLGVAFVSRRAIEKELRLDTLREFRLEGLAFRREFSIVYPRGPELTGMAGEFAMFLRDIRRMEAGHKNNKKSSSRIRTTDAAFVQGSTSIL